VFTQCTECETIFRLSPELLRAAGGQVRCGRCGEVFNALASLAEEPGEFATGESPLELETRADHILESAPDSPDSPEAPGAPGAPDGPAGESTAPSEFDPELPPGVEIATLEVQEWSDDDLPPVPDDADTQTNLDVSLEFTLPPGELDRIFVEAKPPALHILTVSAPHPSAPNAATPNAATPNDANRKVVTPESGTADRNAAAPDTATRESAGTDAPAHSPASGKLGADSATTHMTATEYNVPAQSLAASGVFPMRATGLDISESVRRDVLAGFKHVEEPAPAISMPMDIDIARELGTATPNEPRARFNAWAGASIVLLLILAAQVIHQNRESLAAGGFFGSILRVVYAQLGPGLPAPANLSSYQLRQWGVTGAPGANGNLRVRASILNATAQLQPYPLLRVTLANRFGSRIGARDFEAAEYLGKPTARLLAPGERADATLDILDPGKDAEGFEIDVCLRRVDQRIACAGDAAPHSK
jgi:predicted Zn finger-like uncharacterized protein